MKKKKTAFIVIGLICVIAAFAVFAYLNVPTMSEKQIKFETTYGDKNVTMEASVWDKGDPDNRDKDDYGVVICPGYSCDRRKWRPFSDLFVSNGFTTMTIDYAGQGASTGTIGFDNAKTDKIPVEIYDAVQAFHKETNIPYDHIILMGHSMGGRSILRLIQDFNNPKAETTIKDKLDIKNVILFSPGINFAQNAQASLFAQTKDEVQEPWASFNESYIKGTNVYLFGSTADDIVYDEDILTIYQKLGAKNVPSSGTYEDVQTTSSGSKITVGVTSGILHSYQMYSTKFARYMNSALSDITGKEMNYNPANLYLVYAGWMLALIGLFFLLSGLNNGLEWKATDKLPVLTDEKKFLLRKLLMWLPGILMAFLVCCVCVVIPFGSPTMNIPYMCFIAGYGLTMLIAYRKGKFKGTDGKMPKLSLKINGDKKSIGIAVVIVAALCFFAWYIFDASMYSLVPFNTRIFWLFFASILMTIGYYISGVESDMIQASDASKKAKFLYGLLQYIPLTIFVLFYLFLKSYSGLIGQAVNVVLMYIFCIPLGDYIRKKTGNRLIGALLTAFVFQGSMITSAAMISLF